jgi:hypothetical protein
MTLSIIETLQMTNPAAATALTVERLEMVREITTLRAENKRLGSLLLESSKRLVKAGGIPPR